MKRQDYFIIAATLLVYFIMNRIIPLYGDDIMFSMIGDRKVDTMSDVMTKVFAPGGLARVWCVFLNVMFSSFWGSLAFDIVNTLAFGVSLFIFGKYILPPGDYESRLVGWGAFLIMLFSLCTAKDTLFYWGAGGCFYIIPLVLVYVFLYWFGKVYHSPKNDNVWTAILVLVGAFVLNLHHEMYVCVLLGTFFVYALLNWQKDPNLRRPVVWMFFAGGLLAFAYLVFYGNTLGRAGKTGFGITGIASHLVKSLIDVRITLLLAIILGIDAVKHKQKVKRFLSVNLYWMVSLACGLLPAIAAGQGGRALFISEVIGAILLVKWIYTIEWHHGKVITGGVLLSIFFLSQIVFTWDYYKKWGIFEDAMQRFIANPKSNVVVADDYKGIETPWTLKLNQTFTDHWFVYGYELLKRLKWGTDEEKVVVVPRSLLKAINKGEVFKDENRVTGNAGFYHLLGTDYFVSKCSDKEKNLIKEGLLMVDNTCRMKGRILFKVRLIHIKQQLAKRNVVNIVDDPAVGKFVFIYNKETSIPFTKVTNISFAKPNENNQWMQLSF